MQRTAKAVVSLILMLMMVISILPITAASASSAAAVDPKKIDKVVVDMRSEAAFSELAHIYEHTPTASEPDPYTGGKYSFSDTMKAMRVEYNGNQSAGNTFRIMPAFNEAKTVTMDYKYWVIVYAAKTNKDYSLTLFNSPKFGEQVTVTENGKDTGGKFVVSEPFDISGADANGRSILSRWTGLTQNNINFVSEDSNAEFYIKEMSFFKSAEDAKAYYSVVDLEKSPSKYSSATSSATTTPAGKGLVNISYEPIPEPETEDAGQTEPTEEKRYAPVIINFESAEIFDKTARFNPELTENDEGEWEFVTLEDGTGALRVKFSQHGYYDYYRIMPITRPMAGMSGYHKYVRVTFMTEDKLPHEFKMLNNYDGRNVVLCYDTSVSNGEFIRTNAVDISSAGLAQRQTNGIHTTFSFNSKQDSSVFYIKEIAFFSNLEQAYEYYGDEPMEVEEPIQYTELKFGAGEAGTAARDEASWGNSEDTDEGLVISYLEQTNFANVKYMAKVKSAKRDYTKINERYIRVLYSAVNPEGLEKASMLLKCDRAIGGCILLTDSVTNTNGKFELTEPAYMSELMAERFYGSIHNSLIINAANPGGEYVIKAIYFFETREDAERFSVEDETKMITINGNDISKYQIVIPENSPINVEYGANEIADLVKHLTGKDIPVVTDAVSETKYEILIGLTNRTASYKYFDEDRATDIRRYRIFLEGDKLVLTSVLGLCTVTAIETAKDAIFYEDRIAPAKITVDDSFTVRAVDSQYKLAEFWTSDTLVEDPIVFTEDFDKNDGYINEDNGEKNWKYESGAYKTNATDFASSYIHVYETNVNYKAKLSYTSENDGTMGIMARVNSEKAYVKAGYDFAKGVWYIEFRAGGDHFVMRQAEAKATVTANTVYELELTVISDKASLKVNGKEVIKEADLINHVSPGRLGVYAENASVTVDDIEITLLSGQGTVFANVSHTKFGKELYLEGGSVFVMNDGSWIYQRHTGETYVSTDNGYTWIEREKWTDSSGYMNILRLNNGDWLKITRNNTHIISQTSSDDGKTWVDGGNITTRSWNGNSTAGAGNMNDKIMQTASGRILYSQNYESAKAAVNGRHVFCEFFWSDDNGKTWTKSDTASWELEGNEDQAYFGECKLLECADGTIRVYASWHPYDTIVYADSTDGGKTFGPMQAMENMYTPQSSMQFVRDVYADNDYTYYMVWCNMPIPSELRNRHTPRSRLSLAKTTDGKNWEYIGDIWRWESTPMIGETIINHIVDPFIKVTEDYIICGSGFSDSRHTPTDGGASAHQGQRQHIFTIRKDTLPEGKALNVFKDVPLGADYYEAVTFAVEQGLFNGVSATEFAPDTTMNRAMFVTVLGRLDKADVSKYTTPTFDDVKADQWYTSYVEWAAASGIVNGIGNGLYGINGEITVEQACTILYRYAASKGNTVGTGVSDCPSVTDFEDSADISDWAKDSVKWAVENGIYAGHGDELVPKSAASRALVATMFANYVKVFG